MAKMLFDPPNFLVLDEPTNHLDMATKEVLVSALADFEGTMLFVSHDRLFLAALSNRVLELTPEGVHQYGGGYTDYVARTGQEAPGLHPWRVGGAHEGRTAYAARCARGRAALGTGLKEFASRGVPWIIEASGFDYCMIDHEHGALRPRGRSPISPAGFRPPTSRRSCGSTSPSRT